MLARQLGETFFNEKLNVLCMVWLKDPIFTLRETALHTYKQLMLIFGEKWAIVNFFPKLFELQNETSYLQRITPFLGVILFGEIMPLVVIRQMLIPLY
jgi:serine/threonine-protein phosphatase 2A regulatory subunit A